MMNSRFVGGPAHGQALALRRAPLYLRVVHSEAGEWDALNLLDDQPRPDEAVFVYRLTGPPSCVHLLVRGKNARSRGGWFRNGVYAINPEQPPDAVLRDNAKWQTWARIQPAEYLPGPAAIACGSCLGSGKFQNRITGEESTCCDCDGSGVETDPETLFDGDEAE